MGRTTVAPAQTGDPLETALAQIERQFGKGTVMYLGDESFRQPVEVIPTGSLSLDAALGVGGLARGRVVEIFGPEGSGKTTIAAQVVAAAQAQGGKAAFIDAEHAMDPEYFARIGVDTDKLLVSQPDSGEQALQVMSMLVGSGELAVVVVDSVAALTPQAELDGDVGDTHVGRQARLMSQALRMLSGSLNKTRTTAIFINQLREKVGVVFGSPEVTSGGRALKFYASVRLDVRRIETLKAGKPEAPVGSRTRVTVAKNKMASPFRKCEFDIRWGEGIDRPGELLDLGVLHAPAVVGKAGAWYTYRPTSQASPIQLGNGREAARSYLETHPEVAAHMEAALRASASLGLPQPLEAASEPAPEQPEVA